MTFSLQLPIGQSFNSSELRSLEALLYQRAFENGYTLFNYDFKLHIIDNKLYYTLYIDND